MNQIRGYRPMERDETEPPAKIPDNPPTCGSGVQPQQHGESGIRYLARLAQNMIASRDAEIAALKQAVATLGHEVYGLRGVQRDLCDTCEANGLGKRGRCYGLRMATDANALACAAVKPAQEVQG